MKEEIAGGVELGSDEGVAWTDVPKVSDFLFQHLEEDQAGKWSIKPPTIQDNKSYRLPDEKKLSDIEKLVMLLYQKLYNIKMIHSSDVVEQKHQFVLILEEEIASSLGGKLKKQAQVQVQTQTQVQAQVQPQAQA